MAIKLLSALFDFPENTIVRDISYDIERRLVEQGVASYDLTSGVEATVPTLEAAISATEREMLSVEDLVFKNPYRTGRGWVDVLSSLYSSGAVGPKSPDWVKLVDDGSSSAGIWVPGFDSGTEESLQCAFHVPHGIVNGIIYPHVHWTPTTVNTGVVRWGIEFAFAPGYSRGTFPNSQITYLEAEAGGVIGTHHITEVADPGIEISNLETDGVIIARVFRDASHANDTYPDDAAGFFVDLHIELDRLATPNRNFPFD